MPDPGQLESVLAQLSTDRQAREAWGSLFEMLWPRVKAATYRAVGGRMDLAEDAAQEVFVRLLRYCDFRKFTEAPNFLAYLRTVARNTAIDIRREAAWHTVDISEQEVELSRTFPVQSAEQRAATSELFARVWEYLSDDEKVIAGLIAEGFSIREIARRLAITDNALSVRWFRLRTRVRNSLKEHGVSRTYSL
jgi:RNA polymerase sigma factor (sigma-70 family)